MAEPDLGQGLSVPRALLPLLRTWAAFVTLAQETMRCHKSDFRVPAFRTHTAVTLPPEAWRTAVGTGPLTTSPGLRWQRARAVTGDSEGLSASPACSFCVGRLGEGGLGKTHPGTVPQKRSSGLARLASTTVCRLHCNQGPCSAGQGKGCLIPGLVSISSYISVTGIRAKLLFKSDQGY